MSDNEKEHVIHALSLVLDEYSEWFGRIMRKSFYPKESRDTSSDPPANYAELLKDLEEHGVHGNMTETLRTITAELHKAAEKLMNSGTDKEGRPEVMFMDDMINLYDEFVTHIRRLEKDKLLDGSGIHPLTGLRTEEAMLRDLQQEMERKARRGKPFCIVFARIDGFGEFIKTAGNEEIEQLLRTVADITRLCVRTYDDAYYTSEGEFVLCLKHADINGGLAAVNRLRRMLKENGKGITMSCVTAEPEEGEDVINLLGYLREDLDRYVTEKDVSLQYYEVSPLKRYLEHGELKDNE
jgi:diguanylate cyclase (GGDEF)-like protein